jgi:hypothetical protein
VKKKLIFKTFASKISFFSFKINSTNQISTHQMEEFNFGDNADLWDVKNKTIKYSVFLNDTTQNQAKQGKDIQGMSWNSRYSRAK